MAYDLTILIPTYNRNADLYKAVSQINEAQRYLKIKLCVIILDNNPNNNLKLESYQNIKIFYNKNNQNIGGRGSFARLLDIYYEKSLSDFAIFLTDDDEFINFSAIKKVYDVMSQHKDKLVFQFNGRQYNENKIMNLVYSPLIPKFGLPAALDSFRVMSGCGLNIKSVPTLKRIRETKVSFQKYAYPMQFLAMCNLPQFMFVNNEVFWHKLDNTTYWDYENHRDSFWLNRLEVLSHLKIHINVNERNLIEIVYKRFVSRNVKIFGLKEDEKNLVICEDKPFLESIMLQKFFAIKQKTENLIIRFNNFVFLRK